MYLSLHEGSRSLILDVKRQQITLAWEGQPIWRQSLQKLLFSSHSRPWHTDASFSFCQAQVEKDALLCHFEKTGESAEITLRLPPQGAVSLSVIFKNLGNEPLENYCCAVLLHSDTDAPQKVTIPHVIYNDNPSADPERIVPHIGKEPGKGVIVEEHRLPIPGVNLEWKEGQQTVFFSVLSLPKVVIGEDRDYWSLGALYGSRGDTVALLSGPLMFAGIKDMVYGGQCTPLSYERGYRTLFAGQTLEKSWLLDFGFIGEGRGFRNLVQLGFEALHPHNQPAHSFREMVEYKKMVLDTRYQNTTDSCGYLCFGAANDFGNLSRRPEYYLYAWTGQSLKLAWGECVLGLQYGETHRLQRALDAVGFFVHGSEGDVPGLLRCYYMIEEKSWRGGWDKPDADLSSRMEGEALMDLIDILSLLRSHQQQVPAAWEMLAQRCCEFLSDPAHWTQDGIFPAAWTVQGAPASQMINTAGVPCVAALVKAAGYFSRPAYLQTAQTIFSRYYDYHMKTFDLPFSRSTLDAKCEDKEAGIYMFLSAALLYRATGEPFYQEAADVAADWLLTFVYFWETGFRPGSVCHQKGFCTTGWPGVSVQNHHLDVFFPSWEMYDYGKATGNQRRMQMGRTVAQALTYGVCTQPGEWGYSVVGEQGEQYYQTNYFQIRYPTILRYLSSWRGGMQNWNPSWITAQVLQASLRFLAEEEQGELL